MKAAGARGRVDLFVACALFGLVSSQDAVGAGEHRPGAFEILSREVAAWDARLATRGPAIAAGLRGPNAAAGEHRLGAFEILSRHVAASQVRLAGRLAVVEQAPAAQVDTKPVQLGPANGPPLTSAEDFLESPPPSPPGRPRVAVPTSPSEWFNPRGRHEGTEGIVADLAKLGVTDNGALYVNECWGRAWGAATSDHHRSQLRSWACDLSVAGVQVPTPEADEAARRIGAALGEPGWTRGNLKKTIDGYRIQVLWRVAGHHNHVHVGARKL